jgi:hypothetical protein
LRHALTISEVFTVVFSPPGFVSFALRLKKKRLHRLARRYSQLSHTLNQRHLQRILREFITHYNRGRPHSALGPGFPQPIQTTVPASGHRHGLPPGYCIAQSRCSTAYIMDIAWRRRLRNRLEYFRTTGSMRPTWKVDLT